ncbi:MAG TPA: Panacea domain-containing protein [Pirellulales bacterium]|nr:Panacea domain-containing protein [Pirellulales bacterium]
MMTRPFRFDKLKTMQAVAFLLRREPARRMNFMRLLTVLYFAEREILAESGKPLTGSHVVSTRRGPVLADVLALIQSQHIATPEWSKFFSRDRYQIVMTDDPGVTHLSRFVASKLEDVAKRYEDLDEWAMAEEACKLAEWQRNEPGDSVPEIPLLHILEAVGRGSDYDRIVAGARQDALAADFFSDSKAVSAAAPIAAS